MKIETAVAEVTGLSVEAACARVGDEVGRDVREVYRNDREGVVVWECVGMKEVHFLETPVGFQASSDVARDFPELDGIVSQ